MASADSPAQLLLQHVSVRDVRNIAHLEMKPAPRLNVIHGSNGHGKTTLLEALYLVATSRSFRTARLAELVRHDAEYASVRASFAEHDDATPPITREQRVTLQAGRATVRIDGNRPKTLAEFATRSPVVVFHPDELALSHGPATVRRRLLDRIALFLDPSSADHRTRYARAHRSRQHLLRRGATQGLDAFEELCATHGAALTRVRARAVEALVTRLVPSFGEIAAPEIVLRAAYAPGGSDDPEAVRQALAGSRGRDAHRPSASFGPHRDDLALYLDDRPARVVASQGQHRALTLALKAAEAITIGAIRGVLPILLLDDVSSELDAERTEALFSFLAHEKSQVFLTTTRPELIVTPWLDVPARRDFRIDRGVLHQVR